MTSEGWELAPAYDLNPTLSTRQSLLINRDTDEANIDILLSSAYDYMLQKATAQSIINEVKQSIAGWQMEARKPGLPQRDIDMFSSRIKL